MGTSQRKIGRLLNIDRGTVKKALETDECRQLVEKMKRLVLLLGPKACEILAEDLSYNGEDHHRPRLRNKTAMKILEVPSVFPRDSRGNVYNEAMADKQQINVDKLAPEDFMKEIERLIS